MADRAQVQKSHRRAVEYLDLGVNVLVGAAVMFVAMLNCAGYLFGMLDLLL